MGKLKYESAYNGEWVQPVMKGFELECCRCGLIHKVNFRIVEKGSIKKVQFQAFKKKK